MGSFENRARVRLAGTVAYRRGVAGRPHETLGEGAITGIANIYEDLAFVLHRTSPPFRRKDSCTA